VKRIATVVPLALLLLLAASAVYTIDQTEYGIVLRFGDPVRTVTEPGLHLKAPFPIDRVTRFDRRLMVFDMPKRDEPPREFLTLDKKNIEVSSYTCWRIADPKRYLETVATRQGAEAYLGDILVSELGKVLGRHDLHELISVEPDSLQLAEMTDEIHATCAEAAAKECGVEIVDFGIKRVNFPEQNRNSVFERMRAERKQIATRYRSEGEEQATAIRAEANRQRMEILASARREALEVEGKAEAEAARIYNKAHGKNPEFYEFLRTLESYEKTLGDGTTVLLPPDMGYLKLLIDPDRRGMLGTVPDRRASSGTRGGGGGQPGGGAGGAAGAQ
jgi:membrane protease subunit HflC